MVPVANGRYLADRIAGARFVEIDGDFHVSWRVEDQRKLTGPLVEFLFGSTVERAPLERVLTTVLFTDIVDSTRQATELGDARWRSVLDAHDAIVREEIERFRGRAVNTTGDGFLASFDGPARAVQCAKRVVQRVRECGVQVRAGVHTGECEQRGDDLAGIAVHVGARVMSLAGPGEVLTSRTVRDLVAGSGITFEARGEHHVKGVDEPVSVYSAT
jgi:class 3 adenylate cyclase